MRLVFSFSILEVWSGEGKTLNAVHLLHLSFKLLLDWSLERCIWGIDGDSLVKVGQGITVKL